MAEQAIQRQNFPGATLVAHSEFLTISGSSDAGHL